MLVRLPHKVNRFGLAAAKPKRERAKNNETAQ